ncbi:phosphoribosylglycinamide formyltransferase [Ophiocordyceps camponoti-floridani]|uniref:phosphoribosylglycinamide formyltransferase 1 n=1 Tax=Ophiocordyceps camponoti-floridani TaxID=2030778 RepID=A0A8H4Q606_9HYPO|nr:phosphoribosylglycinamide formyltransferase [Ophiocordyceps camponoti-floridani]
MTCKIVVLASGSGTNFEALCDGLAQGRIRDAAITRLIVNRAAAGATARADRRGVPWEYFNLVSHGFQAKGEKDPVRVRQARDEYDAALAVRLLALSERPDLVVLAGWMYVFGPRFLEPLAEAGVKVINLHPALPGRYDGAQAIERAYQDFRAGRLERNTTGVMVHYVIQQVDRGEAIVTREVECKPDDDLERLKARMHAVEHELIVEATDRVVAELASRRRGP